MSHEFQVFAAGGENEIAVCDTCSYAANVEKSAIGDRFVAANAPEGAPYEIVETPGQHTVEEVASFLGAPATSIVKTLIYQSEGGPLAVLVRGDHAVNDEKLRAAVGAAWVEMADEATVERLSSAPVGFAGPIGLADGVRLIADLWCAARATSSSAPTPLTSTWCTFPSTGTRASTPTPISGTPSPATRVRAGRRHPGHRARHRSWAGLLPRSALLGADGGHVPRRVRPESAARYGLLRHRHWPARWPRRSSSTTTSTASSGRQPSRRTWSPCLRSTRQASGRRAAVPATDLQAAGVDVLFDDRDERAGVKFNDADLIGVPFQGHRRQPRAARWRGRAQAAARRRHRTHRPGGGRGEDHYHDGMLNELQLAFLRGVDSLDHRQRPREL